MFFDTRPVLALFEPEARSRAHLEAILVLPLVPEILPYLSRLPGERHGVEIFAVGGPALF